MSLVPLALVAGLLMLASNAQAPTHGDPPIGLPSGFVCAFNDASQVNVVTFLCVDGVTPWAALVVNPSLGGIDLIQISYDSSSRTLTITASEDQPTAVVTILVNKQFLEQHVDGFASDRELRLTNGVEYGGEGSHPIAAGQAMLVFQIGHFSTQTIAISPGKTVLIGLTLGIVAVAAVVALAIRAKRK